MVIGNSMTAVAVAPNRLDDDIRAERPRIEARARARRHRPRSAAPGHPAHPALGTHPPIDSTETTRLVFFPGTMVAMLLAGAAAVDAV
jgi:putative ABC transport system permease protein